MCFFKRQNTYFIIVTPVGVYLTLFHSPIDNAKNLQSVLLAAAQMPLIKNERTKDMKDFKEEELFCTTDDCSTCPYLVIYGACDGERGDMC